MAGGRRRARRAARAADGPGGGGAARDPVAPPTWSSGDQPALRCHAAPLDQPGGDRRGGNAADGREEEARATLARLTETKEATVGGQVPLQGNGTNRLGTAA